MARLLFYRGKAASDAPPLFMVRLRQGRTRIGRTDDCDIVLPDNEISRSHALIDLIGEHYQLMDRSSNGTFRNQERIKSARLEQGDWLRFGPFYAQVELREQEHQAPTEDPQPESRHEEILEVHEGLTFSQAQLLIRSGSGEGQRYRLKGARFSVGGRGSRIILPDPGLVRDHVFIRLYEGRAMVEPGQGASWLGRSRIRDILPLNPGEEVRIGSTELSISWDTQMDTPVAERFGELVGQTPIMQRLFGILRRMAAHEAPVLLLGASGTGKELCAKGIHDASPRAGRPFVAINCGAIPSNLFESEMFGHEKGSFTGANDRKDGAFLRADGGTLFLDEAGELPEDAQVKLLRTLESGEVRRVGGSEIYFPDIRIVAATNRNLLEAVQARKFRQDLYFRLAVLTVPIPALKDRSEDIALLAETLLRRNHPGATLTPEAIRILQGYHWPGNVRELRNVLTRAFVLGGSPITPEFLEFQQTELPPSLPGRNALEEAERELVLEALRKNGNNRSRAARALGIPRTTLVYKLQRWGIEEA
jgi:transcriptional regulator with AAA-type ATPase domain/pSer/pThr/pTyr-binding forkhead associated (FHA) protein